jgi:hypothetical protein
MADRVIDGPSMGTLADRFEAFDVAGAHADAGRRMTAVAGELTAAYSSGKERM